MSENYKLFEEYSKSITKLIVEDKLNDATLKILDFTKEVLPKNESFVKSSILIRRRYIENLDKELNQLDKPENISIAYNNISNDILKLISRGEKFDSNILTDHKFEIPKSNTYFESKEEYLNESIDRSSLMEDQVNVVFKCEELMKSYKDRIVLNNITFKMNHSQIYGLVGPNASGKTTLLEIIAGIRSQSFGMIEYPKFKYRKGIFYWKKIKSDIGYIPQTLTFPTTSVQTFLLIAAKNSKYRIDNLRLEVEWIMERLNLSKYSEYRIDQLSEGYKMRLALAKELLKQPKLLVLDEPLANLDVRAQHLFLTDLREISKSISRPMSVILTSQHIFEVEMYCDNILFLSNGELYIPQSRFDRSVRVYEIATATYDDLTLLRNFLIEKGMKKHRITRNIIVANFPATISENVIFDWISNLDFGVIYFRNISNSSKQFFN